MWTRSRGRRSRAASQQCAQLGKGALSAEADKRYLLRDVDSGSWMYALCRWCWFSGGVTVLGCYALKG
jgi:hypothetical protein